MSEEQIDWLDELISENKSSSIIPEDDKLRSLRILADNYRAVEMEVAVAEENLARLNRLLKQVREEIIPEHMQNMGLKKLILDDGAELSYKPFYSGKLLKDEGLDWLEEAGYPDAVKQELKLEVSRLDKSTLAAIKQFIAQNPLTLKNLSVKEKQSIHHMTLGSIIRELTKRGEALPRDLFETHIGNIATLKEGKSNG